MISVHDVNPVRRTPWVTYALIAANVIDAAAHRRIRSHRGRARRLPGALPRAKDGQGLLISLTQQARLVVDPATSRVRDTNFFVGSDGAESWVFPGTASATIIAE